MSAVEFTHGLRTITLTSDADLYLQGVGGYGDGGGGTEDLRFRFGDGAGGVWYYFARLSDDHDTPIIMPQETPQATAITITVTRP